METRLLVNDDHEIFLAVDAAKASIAFEWLSKRKFDFWLLLGDDEDQITIEVFYMHGYVVFSFDEDIDILKAALKKTVSSFEDFLFMLDDEEEVLPKESSLREFCVENDPGLYFYNNIDRFYESLSDLDRYNQFMVNQISFSF